jgi:P pilus assembly chaperone PapD
VRDVRRNRWLNQAGRALIAALVLSGVSGRYCVAAAQLAVDELEVFLKPGTSTRTGTIRVTNSSDKSVEALVEIQDWDRDEKGGNRFYPLGTEAHSCKERLKVFPLALRLDPGKSESLRVTYDGAAGDACWAVVFIQGNEQRSAAAQSQITYVMRTGVKVYVDPAAATKVGDVESVRLIDLKTATAAAADSVSRQIEVVFKNGGTSHLKAKGAVEIRTADNKVAHRLEILEFPTVPGATRKLLLPLPQTISAGRYIALVLLDYGGNEIAAGQLEFEVK